MSAKTEYDKLMDHEYDGIREYDNPLPSWWSGIFILSIVFAVGYWIYYHAGGPGLSETQEYEAEVKAVLALQAKAAAKSGPVSNDVLAALTKDSGEMDKAKTIFATRCLACHGPKGQGLVGPNLTDNFQVHGSTRSDIYKTIRDGVPAKGMQAWGKLLKPDELKRIAAFVGTLRGTNVAGGKKAEGAKVESF
jgi:cytochrome c oxidase cbb3-type subunit III